MSAYADLHIHTHYSDSSASPLEVVEEASQKGLSCIAITDHDTIDGISPTLDAAKPFNLEVITGVELSCEENGRDIHLLGYCFDHYNPAFCAHLNRFQEVRMSRMEEMIEKLKTFGISDITMDDVRSQSRSNAVGRLHLANLLVEKKHVSDTKAAFDKYLSDGGKAYVPKFKLSPKEAIQLVHDAGGVAVLAHPMLTQVDELIASFVKAGLDGLEAYYPNAPESVIEYYLKLSKKYGLLATGGSDAHGKKKQSTYIGKMKIPYSIVEELKSRARR